jgi:hypothetical protein
VLILFFAIGFAANETYQIAFRFVPTLVSTVITTAFHLRKNSADGSAAPRILAGFEFSANSSR